MMAFTKGGQILFGKVCSLVGAVVGRFVTEPPASDSEETHDLGDQYEKAKVADVAPLGKKLVQSHAVVLEASG